MKLRAAAIGSFANNELMLVHIAYPLVCVGNLVNFSKEAAGIPVNDGSHAAGLPIFCILEIEFTEQMMGICGI